MGSSDGWVLTVAQLGVLWQRLELGVPPVIWNHGARLHRPADPAAERRDAEAELRRSGVLDEALIPDPALAAALRRVERAPLLIDLRFIAAGSDEVRALVVVDGSALVRAVLADGVFRIETLDGADPVAALLVTLPDVHPAPGRKVTVPVDTVDRGIAAALGRNNDSDPAIYDEWVLLGLPKRDAQALLALVCGRRIVHGQIGVTRRRRGLDPIRYGEIVQVVDTRAGRAAMWHRGADLHAAPGTYELFADLVGGLVRRSGG